MGMKPKIVVTKTVPPEVLAYLQNHCEVAYYKHITEENQADFFKDVKEAQGLIGAELLVDGALLDAAPMLKVVSTISVGYDRFDMPEITKRNIIATNTPGVLNDTTADTIFGLMLAAARRFTELDGMVKRGQWKAPVGRRLFGTDVHHKTLGIIGMGGIGTAIAKRAHLGFDMNILYHNRTRNLQAEELYAATYCSLEQLLQQADFVCLMTPLSKETENLMGEKEFKLMKETAIFVNGSRGKTVDEEALVQALQKKEIAAAGLDVYVQEPIDPNHPLLNLDNVITLPHIGSATYETRFNMAMTAATSLVSCLQGKNPGTIINQEIWENRM